MQAVAAIQQTGAIKRLSDSVSGDALVETEKGLFILHKNGRSLELLVDHLKQAFPLKDGRVSAMTPTDFCVNPARDR